MLPFGQSTANYRAREKLRRKHKSEAPKNLMERLLAAFCGRCEYCGSECREPHTRTTDRIVPGRRGGLYTLDNVTLACRKCNAGKCDREFIGPVRSLQMMEGGHG